MYFTNVLQFLERSAEEYPERTAFADPEGEITFRDLCLRAKSIGSYLAGLMKPQEAAAFYMEKSVPAVAAMFGAVYAGGFYSFIDVRQPAARADKALEVLAPAVLITDSLNEEKAAELSYSGKILRIEDLFAVSGPSPEDEKKLAKIREGLTDTMPLYVNFTSGSTGTPKGVAVAHRSVIEFISHFVPLFGIAKEDILANQAPFDFDVSVKDIYSGLFAGAKVQLIPREYFSRPAQLMDYLADSGASVLIWAVSAMCFVSIMNALEYKTPKTVRLVMFSGEVMPVKQLRIWKKYLPKAQYVNLYGPTEITCNCTYFRLEDRDYDLSEVIPAGRPFPNEKVFLLDENDREVTKDEPGKEGEICVAGTCLALGYYKDPVRTDAAFMLNPLSDAWPERMYRTGDIGRYDEEGNLVYVSRKDFQIKHMGHRIELGEIEANAMARDGVSRACCIYDDAKHRLVLFYTGERGKKELEEELKLVLPPFMVPGKVLPLEEMPLNKNGKIDRQALFAMYAGSSRKAKKD